jgi:xanthine dehydrogenase small subunit
MTTAPVRFLHGGRWVEASPARPTRTVLEWLREEARCVGTKEGCAEGDCGACTVAVGEPAADGMRYRAVNACIQFLPTLHGKHLVTVDNLHGVLEGAPGLHPVQHALVAHHGSQCGFCTPGFVMSLFALYESKRRAGETAVTREEAIETLAGNLCRCTGYRPILDAAQSMLDIARHGEGLPPGVDQGEDAALAAALRALPDCAVPDFLAPRTESDFDQLRLDHPDACILAGGTDVGLWVTKQHRALGPVLYLGRVHGFDRIQAASDALVFGPAVSLTDAWAALVAEYPSLRDYAQRFASPPIRHAGTLAGNVANGSPIGDSMPVLIALGAQVLLQRGGAQRSLALEDFYLGYRRTALAPGEYVRAVRVPRLPAGQWMLRAYKLSKRREQDIAAVALGIALHVAAGVVQAARIGAGGMAATPVRARRTEAALTGQPWNQATVDAAAQALHAEFSPIDDMRASAAYRSLAAANLLRRCWLESQGRVVDLQELPA